MSEIVDRVARALWELETETDCPEWDQLADFRKNETRQKARAAIAAICITSPLPHSGGAVAELVARLRTEGRVYTHMEAADLIEKLHSELAAFTAAGSSQSASG